MFSFPYAKTNPRGQLSEIVRNCVRLAIFPATATPSLPDGGSISHHLEGPRRTNSGKLQKVTA